MSLRALREDARELSPEEFEARHGSAFLLLTASGLSEPSGPASTAVHLLDDAPGESTASVSLVAYPVARTGRSVGHLITIGRAANNDVVVPDVSISRFHAFLKPTPDGRYLLQDAGSTNGTTVNGSSVPSQGAGEAVQVKTGDNVRLGQVELTFLEVKALRQFAQKFER